jgi:hypothetical protein
VITPENFKKWFNILFAETFGVTDLTYGYALDNGQAGLLGTIDRLDAGAASTALKPGGETVASHCGHVHFILRWFHSYGQGQPIEADWEGSWQGRTVDAAAWDALRAELRSLYAAVVEQVNAVEQWGETPLSACMILLAHCSYHLGEAKQIISALP